MSAPKPLNTANMATKMPETSPKDEIADDDDPVTAATDVELLPDDEPRDELPEEPLEELLGDGMTVPEIMLPLMLPPMLPPEEEVVVAFADVDAGVEEPPEPPEPADAAHEQTARAEDDAWRPVTAPQLLTTQLRASELMADDAELEHWQAKSVYAQPTCEAADVMHDVAQVGMDEATLKH